MSARQVGDRITELKVTPDKYVPHRYAGASGDFNPIHIDADFARMVGLPGAILHGLYVMGLVAKGATVDIADGDPRALKRLSVQFRGMSYPEQEITVSGEVTEVKRDEVKIDLIASQCDSAVIRKDTATLDIGS